jgi:hypothetical protein
MKMGKQAKISIAIVSVVMVVIGIGAAKKICTSTSTPEAANSTGQSPAASAEGGQQITTFRMNPDWDSKQAAPFPSPPRVVLPVTVAAKPSYGSPREGNAAGVIGEISVQPTAGVPAVPQPPTFMPTPRKSNPNLADHKGNPPSLPPSWKPSRKSDTLTRRPTPEYQR